MFCNLGLMYINSKQKLNIDLKRHVLRLPSSGMKHKITKPPVLTYYIKKQGMDWCVARPLCNMYSLTCIQIIALRVVLVIHRLHYIFFSKLLHIPVSSFPVSTISYIFVQDNKLETYLFYSFLTHSSECVLYSNP